MSVKGTLVDVHSIVITQKETTPVTVVQAIILPLMDMTAMVSCSSEFFFSCLPDACSSDIDECSTNNGGCSQNCSNTHGSYICFCNSGYNITFDGFDCEGEFTLSKYFNNKLIINYTCRY